jgi:hypothetical protein
MTLPTHIVGENADTIEPRLTTEISERRETSDGTLAE